MNDTAKRHEDAARRHDEAAVRRDENAGRLRDLGNDELAGFEVRAADLERAIAQLERDIARHYAAHPPNSY